MKKKYGKAFLAIILCWILFVSMEGFRLIGSTDPGKHPLLYISEHHIQDELAEYGSLGFSQVYHLSTGDAFVYGEFRVLGMRVAMWEKDG